MSITKSIEAMRKIVCMYDKIQAKKNKIRNKADKALSVVKGGNNMKFGTIIGIVVGAITLLAAGAAAMYLYLNGCPCCRKGCCEDDGDLYDEFPEEEASEEPKETEEPAEEASEEAAE